jgi:hypothetical protein
MIQVDPNKRPSALRILTAKWFVRDISTMTRVSRIYDTFPIIEIAKRINSMKLEEPEAKKPKTEN